MRWCSGVALALASVAFVVLWGPSRGAPEFDRRHAQRDGSLWQRYIESRMGGVGLDLLKPSDTERLFTPPTVSDDQGSLLHDVANLHKLPSDPGFPFNQSKVLAAFESVSYCRDEHSVLLWNCSRCQWDEVMGFVPDMTVYDPKWDVFAFVGYFPTWDAIIVSIRGTNSHDMWNWIEDFDSWKSKYPLPYPGAEGAQIHSGFYKLWAESALKGNVTQAVGRLVNEHGVNGTVHVVGHSMGGAMAELCALWLKFNFNLTDVRVTTFGQPRTGNKQFARFHNATIPHTWRFTRNKDIVPSLPFEFMGYWHTPREVWQRDSGSSGADDATYRLCDVSGEDPTCHDSICHFVSCTSIKDHMMYMGYPMYTDSALC